MSELKHYGVKGMKWGVRKDPYSGYNRIPRRRKTDSSSLSSSETSSQKKSGLSRNQKIAIGIAAAVAIAGVSYAVIKSKQDTVDAGRVFADGMMNEKNAPLSNDIRINEGLSLGKDTLEQIASGNLQNLSLRERLKVEKEFASGYLTNCKCCTAAAALRTKGYDVVACPSDTRFLFENFIYWKNAKIESLFGSATTDSELLDLCDTFDEKIFTGDWGMDRGTAISKLNSRISSYGDGVYGELSISTGVFGHSVDFRVEHGGVKVYDRQLEQSYSSLSSFFSLSNGGKFDPVRSTFTRFDTAEPNLDLMIKSGVVKYR